MYRVVGTLEKEIREIVFLKAGDTLIQVTENMRVIFFEGPDGERVEFVEKK